MIEIVGVSAYDETKELLFVKIKIKIILLFLILCCNDFLNVETYVID